ncbi:BTB/POZ domain-containing protein 9-like [Oppia nitens]|uniref:BTB/POZ domain-containing protein 9-like n=1 Tax=Oppia nitens TaxID=1686743 RepID=UPI0023DC03A2|nr:BTB/POZ domain-containing protein 9-like [Oppia nitens]
MADDSPVPTKKQRIDDKKYEILYPEMDYVMNPEVSDVKFLIDGQTIPAIKALMSTKSTYFRSMFSGNWLEKNEIEIMGTSAEAFEVIVKYIYTDRLMFDSNNTTIGGAAADLNHIQDVLILAEMYELRRLAISVGQHLRTMISAENIETIGRLAFRFELDDLIDGLRLYIDQNFRQLMSSKQQPELNAINSAVNNLLFERLSRCYGLFKNKFPSNKMDSNGQYYRYKINGNIYRFGDSYSSNSGQLIEIDTGDL